MRRNARSIDDVGDLERPILVLRAAGLSTRRFGGQPIYRKLLRARGDGSSGGSVNHIAYGVLARRAAGARELRSGPGLDRDGQQATKVGRRLGLGALSDADNTGGALHALDTAGRRDGDPARDAINYLMEHQAPNGTFSGYRTRPNAQSTALAVHGVVAARAKRRDRLGPSLSPPPSEKRRRHSLLELESADAGLGHRAGPPSSEAEAVPARSPSLSQLRRKAGPDQTPCADGAGLGFGTQCGGRSDSDGGRRGTRAASGAGAGGDSSGEGWRQRRTQPLGSPLG